MSREQLDTLFEQYETSFDKFDLKSISGFCADTFISADPQGSITNSKEEYEARNRETINFYKNVGRNSAKIISKRIMPICDQYSMVVLRWGITFEKTGSKLIEFDFTYIIQQTGDDPKIILLISHQDEKATMKKLVLGQRTS